jgi:hypothetical protein
VAWWIVLHALLCAAVVAVAAPGWLKALALSAAVYHGYCRRPVPPPDRLVVASDGHCWCPSLSAQALRLGPKTRYARGWVRLVDRARRLDILLLEDQLAPEDWPRLSALLRRLTLDTAGQGGAD